MSASDSKAYVLGSETHRAFVGSLVAGMPQGWVVEIKPPTRSGLQNALLHAALTDIAEQVEWKGHRFNVLTWKRLCMASWLRERGEAPEMIPALDGNGFDIVYERTSQLSKGDFSELCEWVFRFGAQNGVTFKESAPVAGFAR